MKKLLSCLMLLAVASASAEISEFRDGMPFAREGFGVRRNFYASGRLCCQATDIAGIYKVYYVGPKSAGSQFFYTSEENCSFGRCMLLQVLIGETPYRLTFSNTTHYPFGYTSEFTAEDVKLRHELVLDGNVLFRRLVVLENPRNRPVRAKLVQLNGGMQGTRWYMNETRTKLVAERTDHGRKTTMEIGANVPVAFPLNDRDEKPLAFGVHGVGRADAGQPSVLSFRYDLVPRQPGKEFVFYWAFNPKADEDFSAARVERVFTDFRARRAKDAVFSSDDTVFANAFNFVMPWTAALDVDGMGAIRASTTYWVWGWDAMVHAGTLALTGRADEVRKMLAFFRDVAHPTAGIMHAFGTEFRSPGAQTSPSKAKPGEDGTMPAHVQLFYVILLNDYVQITGDESARKDFLPFARTLVERAKTACPPGERLPHVSGFFPDNPFAVDQQKDDISLINNAIYCQGLRAWTELTGEGAADAVAAEKAIVEKLWDPVEGFWCDAYDVQTGKRRPHYPAYGYFFVSPFGLEVMPTEVGKLADYMRSHFRLGLYNPMFAWGTASHCADGNQLGAYYPVTDRTYWNVMNAANRIEALADFRETVRRHWRVLTYPEGQTADVVNADPAEYTDQLGNKQFFAAKSWLSDALELNLGLRVRKDGLHFHALGDGHPFAVRNLSVRGKRLSISRTGTGAQSEYVLNRQRLDGSFIPWSLLADKNQLIVKCYEIQ